MECLPLELAMLFVDVLSVKVLVLILDVSLRVFSQMY